jgi:hypothetical protein
MARCDCAGGRCSCGVVGGDGIEITGSGEATNPYVISAVGQPLTGQLTVEDTATLNLTLTGDGVLNEPYTISGEVLSAPASTIAGQIEVADTATLNLTLSGGGVLDEPYIIYGDVPLADMLATPAGDVTDAMTGTWVPAVKPELYGAVGDGVADDTAALQAALDTNMEVWLSAKTYRITAPVYVHAGCTLRGVGSGNYGQGAASPTITTIVADANGATAAVVVASRANVSDLMVIAAAPPTYDAGDYPAGTNNVLTGVVLGDAGGSANASRLFVDGFAERGILGYSVSHVNECFVRRTPIGYDMQGSDGWLTHSVAMFCHTAGVKTGGNYWRLIGNRIEWNARWGVDSGGESTIVGNLFDRNGWAGLRLRSAAWGQVVTGNYFSRNGVGGNGTTGRWAFSVPGHPSYVATTQNQSCHILIDYQRAVSITGNRFRAGADDAGGGVSGPNYIFSSEAASGSTFPSNVLLAGNAGITSGDGRGFAADTYSVGSGAIIGGADGALTAALKRMENQTWIGRSIAPTSAQANGTSVVITVRKGSSGKVLLSANSTAAEGMATVYFTRRTSTTGAGYTSFINHIGTPVTAAALAGGTTDDTLTITLDVSRYANYFIEYAN